MVDYQRKSIKMNPQGMSLAYEFDNMPDGLFPLLSNTRFDKNGVIGSRKKLLAIKELQPVALTSPVHLIKRLTYESNDYRLIHIGGKLLLHNLITDGLSVLDTTFSNAPNTTSIIGIRPEESIIPYLYIANTNVFKKFSSDGDYVDVGITAPNIPPIVALAAPSEKSIDEIDGTGYTNSGAAGAPVVVNRVPNTTTLTKLLFDSGSSGWASIIVNTFPKALQSRTEVLLSDATIPVSEKVIIDEVLAAHLTAGVATVSSIQYDSGITGNCTIQLSISPEGLKENSILLLGGTEYVRVKAVVDSVSQGKNTIKVSTVGTFSAGASVSGVASFRAFLQNGTYTITNTTISTDAMKIPFAASGLGYAQKVLAVDLSRIGNRPINENDIIRFAVLASDTTKLDEGQLQLDLSQTAGSFENYIFYPFNPSSLTQSYKQTSVSTLAQQQLIQRTQVRNTYAGDNLYIDRIPMMPREFDFEPFEPIFFVPITAPNELGLGDFQWTVFEIPLKVILQNKVGSDMSRSLNNIGAIRFSFKVNGAVDIYVDSLSIGGTFELNSFLNNEGAINDYYWVYRYRSSKTRTISAWSPPNRDGKFIRRGRAELKFTASLDPQTDKIDIARFGGRLAEFHYVGTTENTATSFFDELPDATAVQNPIADFTLYKPFAILDKSKKGVCNIIGTEVTFVSGDNFDVDWARGSQIIIDGVPNSLYNSPTSTTKCALVKSVGSLSNVSFYLPAPLLTGQTLPVIFGPFGEGSFGLIVFGLGNPNAKGTIYWLNGNSPDIMRDTNYLEITGPDEPLIDGCVFRRVPYVFTNKRCFALRPVATQNGLMFAADEVTTIRGVRGRGCIAVSDAIYIVSHDGIYRFDGGSMQLISYDINPLFPKEKVVPSQITIGGINPSEVKRIINPLAFDDTVQIAAYREFLYIQMSGLFQVGVSPVPGIVVYNLQTQKVVSLDDYIVQIYSINADESQYSDELTFGSLTSYYTYTDNPVDSEGAFSTLRAPIIITPSLDLGDSRVLKEFYEIVLDTNTSFDAGSTGILTNVYFDNFRENGGPLSVISSLTSSDIYRKKTLLELEAPKQRYNIALYFTLLNAGAKLYEAQISFVPQVEKIQHRYTDWSMGEFGGSKILKELIIDANTFGQQITLIVEGDGGIVIKEIQINHNGRKRVAYSLPDNYTLLFRVKQASGTSRDWMLYDLDIRYEQAPDNISSPSKFETGGYLGKKFLQRVIIDADTSGLDILVDIERCVGESVVSDILMNHDGRCVKSYDFNPVTGYVFRLLPKGEMRIFDVQYKFDIEPEGQKIWKTQPTTHDISGFQFVLEILIAIKSTAISTLTLTVDGVDFNYSIPSTNNESRKLHIPLKSVKGKLFEYTIQSEASCVLSQKDCEVRVYSINGGSVQIKNPFGHISREVGTA